MYSRSTGFTPENMSPDYLRAKYAAKTAARSDRRREVFALLPEKEPEHESAELLPQTTEQKDASDNMLIPALLAFLLFSDRDGGNFDFILTAALLFIQFG